jgi:hypothetical protein
LDNGHYALAQWILEERGARNPVSAVDDRNAWSALRDSILDGTDSADLAALSKVMVLLDDAPADVIDELSPAHAKIATRGRQLRARLPSYLERQRALVVAHCPLPAALQPQPLVAGYAAPTPEEMWAEGGLRVRVPRAKRARAVVGAGTPVQRWSLRLHLKHG